jgi:hypothetical protein
MLLHSWLHSVVGTSVYFFCIDVIEINAILKRSIPPESLPSYRLCFYKREMPAASFATFYQDFCADKFSPKPGLHVYSIKIIKKARLRRSRIISNES